MRLPISSSARSTFASLTLTIHCGTSEIGFRGATQDERSAVLAEILKALATYTPSQQEIFFRLLLRALPLTGNALYAPEPQSTLDADGTSDASAGAPANDIRPSDRAHVDVLLDFVLDFVLYDASASASSDTSAAAGLSLPRLERLARVVTPHNWSKEQLYAAQMHALRLLKELDVPTKAKYMHYIAGAASHHHSIKSFCDEQLTRAIKHEFAALEDPDVVRRIVALVLGSHVAQTAGAFGDHERLVLSNRSRIGDASILQALRLLAESKAAANAMPLMLMLLCHVLFGAEPSRPQNVAQRIQLAGVRLCHWTFLHAESAYVAHMLGPVMAPALLRALMDPNADSDMASAAFTREFRQGTYDVLTVLSTRAPSIVAGSEQAFQVLLVRSLVEEERRTGNGASALKAFTALACAYSGHASDATRASIQNELTDLLRGARIFDASKSYDRVRAAIATWCSALLAKSASASAMTMRFALLRLCGDAHAEVQALATQALYTEPVPTLGAVVAHLRAQYPRADLKTSIHDARTVESCLRFCLHVAQQSSASSSGDDMAIADDRRAITAYFVETLLGTSDAVVEGDVAARASMFHAAAASLVAICAFDKEAVAEVLSHAIAPLLDVVCVSSDRSFLHDVAVLVRLTLEVESFCPERIVQDVVQPLVAKLNDPTLASTTAARLQYALGSAIAVLAGSKAFDQTDATTVRAAYSAMVSLLSTTVATCSNFTMFPRGEEDQNARIDFVRSLLDGVGLAGSLTAFLNASDEWMALKLASLRELENVIEWDVSVVSSDGSLKLKLARVKAVAVESLRRAVAGLPHTTNGALTRLTPALDAAVAALLKLGADSDPELQLLVGEALVTLGSHEASEAQGNDAASPPLFAANRAAAIVARLLRESTESRQPTVRRSAATWLLCICAAGLADDSHAAASPAWHAWLQSDAATQSLVDIHEFFVTMLNDSNSIAKESAVKGLAYLRLRAPRRELGDQFSDSLFRRLRCFRAFTAPSAGTAATDLDVDMDAPPTPDTPDASDASARSPAPSASQSTGETSTSNGVTVQNAAYREVSNLAADIGDPELMYALLYLSTTDPLWQTLQDASTASCSNSSSASSSAALFSFVRVDAVFRASIVDKAGKLWMDTSYANTTALVPWLFLLKSHANAKIAEVMTNLWTVAKGDSDALRTSSAHEKTLLQTHWHAIFRFLLGRLERSRNFRYREAACVALVDLLHGADADHVRDEFLHLWKLATAAVDDVMEAVGVAGLKLYRLMGELSLRIAATDAPCRRVLLQYLVSDGIASKNLVCRALGIDVLLRLVKALPADALQDTLAALMLQLLEYLSSLEMPELQYAQFHVQKKEQLERLRVSISQSGPVGQLLELTTTRLKELAGTDACVQIVDELTRGVANLLRFGVGLNTRVGSANFVATLALELPFELRKCRGAELLLTKVFVPFVRSKTASENDVYGDEESRYGAASSGLHDSLVVQTYCRAVAYLCPLVDASLVATYVRTGVFAFNRAERSGDSAEVTDDASTSPPSSSDANRYLLITAIATKELVAKVPPIADATTVVQADRRNDWYCTHVFPGAFIGQFALTDVLQSTWTAVLDELPPSVRYADASIDATLAAIAQFLTHPAWDTRKQAARALHALFANAASSYRSRITAEQTARIWQSLVDAVPGRLWTGKGVVLEALVALAGVTHSTEDRDGDSAVLARQTALATLLLDECERAWRNRDMAYMESAVASIGALSAQLSGKEAAAMRLANFGALQRAFLVWLDSGRSSDAASAQSSGVLSGTTTDHVMADASSSATGTHSPPPDAFVLPPLLVKCVFEALGQSWPSALPLNYVTPATESTSTDAIAWLCASATDTAFSVWSVRKAVFEALAAVVASAPASVLAAAKTAALVLDTCCGDAGVRDAKFSMIRVAAASVLVALTQRHGESHGLALVLTVHRERLSATLDVLRASEEPAEQRAAFATMTHLLALQ